MKRVIPQLWKTHPNFFIIYFATAVVLHIGMGLTHLVNPERYSNLAFAKVYEVAPRQIWGIAFLMVWLFMTIGAYRKFYFWGRLGLGLGLFLCLSRGLLIELGPGSGGGLFVWIPLAVIHYVLMAEPTLNPLNKKE